MDEILCTHLTVLDGWPWSLVLGGVKRIAGRYLRLHRLFLPLPSFRNVTNLPSLLWCVRRRA